jgi:hypothetical protein
MARALSELHHQEKVALEMQLRARLT